MLPSRSEILAEAVNTMENVQWVAIDPSELVCGASDTVFIRRVIILRHIKAKNFSRTSAGPKEDFLLHAITTPTTTKALQTRKIIKLGFLSLPLREKCPNTAGS